MPPSSLNTTASPDFIHRLFAYQQTKRLHLLIDQLLWSFDQLNDPNQFAIFHPHLRYMVEEAKHHVADLDHRPG